MSRVNPCRPDASKQIEHCSYKKISGHCRLSRLLQTFLWRPADRVQLHLIYFVKILTVMTLANKMQKLGWAPPFMAAARVPIKI